MDKYNCASKDEYTCGDPYMPDLKLSEAYVKDQIYRDLLPINVGFRKGTIFKELVRPWEVKK